MDFSIVVPLPTEAPINLTQQLDETASSHTTAMPSPGESSASPAIPPSDHKEPEPLYGKPPDIPTQDAVSGILFDFNEGLRVKFPSFGGPWRICFRDLDTGVVLYNQDVKPNTFVTSVKKFYIRFRLEIYQKSELDALEAAERAKGPYRQAGPDGKTPQPPEPKPLFSHDFDPAGREVVIQLPVGTMGDVLGWFPYVEKFRIKNQCTITAVLLPHFADLLRVQYPEIEFITKEQMAERKPYASYYLGLFFRGNVDNQPCDFRYVGLHRTAGYILGVDPTEEPPRLDLSAPRQILEPYVCIAAQSSSQAKYWNNPHGWWDVVAFLKDHGYRVLCVDRDPVYGVGLMHNHIPYGSEDCTGPLPLQERVNLIKDADFFIGLSSGLSWLAWACRVPVVMISGFTHPTNEFYTPYRIINFHTCNSCWNDMRLNFDHFDFLWCPRHKNTDRQFECTRLITSKQVMETIEKIPAFQNRINQK